MSEEQNIKKQKSKLWIVIAGLLLAVAIIGICIFVNSSGAEAKKISGLLSDGKRYLSELDYDKAIVAFEEVISIDAKNAEAYLGLAEVYCAKAENDLKNGAYDSARDNYQKAIDVLTKGYDNTQDERIKARKKAVEELLEGVQEPKEEESEEKEQEWVVTKETGYSPDGTVNYLYEYDSDGHITKGTIYYPDGAVDYLYEYEYDSAGNGSKYTSYLPDGTVEQWCEYEYDDNGNIVKIISYNSDGIMIGWTEYEFIQVISQKNNK